VTSGPYKYLRNPAYTGALITLVGFGFGAGNWISVIFLLIIGLAAYAWRIAVEDKALRERFGEEYEDYKKRTWALIPFIW
jgi:protein-S-isoprenylcysteine O-methyltransferase